PPLRAAVREWLAAPTAAPAACGLLAGWRNAGPFAAALESAEAAALTRGVAAAFGLGTGGAVAGTGPTALHRFVPEADELPPGPRRAALALGLLLARAPHLARDGTSI